MGVIMNVLVVDANVERRNLVSDALSWIEAEYRLIEANSLEEARAYLKQFDFRLVIIGPDLPCDTRSALIFMRGSLPHSALLTCMNMSSFDRDETIRLVNCGADLVFDQRLSATKLALVLRPYLGHGVATMERIQDCRHSPIQPAFSLV